MTTLKQCSNLEIAKSDEEWVVLNANCYTVTKLNKTGGYILSLLERPLTVDMLVAALRDSFEENIDADVQDVVSRYLARLLDIGLIEHAVPE